MPELVLYGTRLLAYRNSSLHSPGHGVETGEPWLVIMTGSKLVSPVSVGVGSSRVTQHLPAPWQPSQGPLDQLYVED